MLAQSSWPTANYYRENFSWRLMAEASSQAFQDCDAGVVKTLAER